MRTLAIGLALGAVVLGAAGGAQAATYREHAPGCPADGIEMGDDLGAALNAATRRPEDETGPPAAHNLVNTWARRST